MNRKFREEYIKIHHAIHDANINSLTINGIVYPIELHTSGCRYVDYTYLDKGDNEVRIRLKAQNPGLKSHFGRMAERGTKITWVLAEPAWFYITDERIEEYLQSKLTQFKMAI